jgi:hypothetical protein
MAIEEAEGRRGDIGPKRVQNIMEGDRGLKRGHWALHRGGQMAVEGLGCRGTEDRRGGRGP